MNNITRIDGSPHVHRHDWIQLLHEAVEVLIATNISNILWKTAEKQAFREAAAKVQQFLSWIGIQANLIDGDYEAALKMVALSPHNTTDKLKDLPNRAMIIALLARLKGTKKRLPMPRSNVEEKELDTIVDGYIAKDWDSTSSAISAIGSSTNTSAKS